MVGAGEKAMVRNIQIMQQGIILAALKRNLGINFNPS
jgi:hypothetical protein